jgi:hypothetical protein
VFESHLDGILGCLAGLKRRMELICDNKRDTDIYIECSEEEDVHSKDQKAETSRHLFDSDIQCSNSIAHKLTY